MARLSLALGKSLALSQEAGQLRTGGLPYLRGCPAWACGSLTPSQKEGQKETGDAVTPTVDEEAGVVYCRVGRGETDPSPPLQREASGSGKTGQGKVGAGGWLSLGLCDSLLSIGQMLTLIILVYFLTKQDSLPHRAHGCRMEEGGEGLVAPQEGGWEGQPRPGKTTPQEGSWEGLSRPSQAIPLEGEREWWPRPGQAILQEGEWEEWLRPGQAILQEGGWEGWPGPGQAIPWVGGDQGQARKLLHKTQLMTEEYLYASTAALPTPSKRPGMMYADYVYENLWSKEDEMI
ncbi:hypothetical protein E2C01_014382 [Portunus trituberculatus]|uniref:Uncharacterized protein n=1 Tax=Portunus trituberculatus TaxID=210409 RepID=A0A5B7DJV2_PORTR|nr:hypothetical protein [Portunus trituberculatus]